MGAPCWATLSLFLVVAHELDSPYRDSLFLCTHTTLLVLTYYNFVILQTRVVYVRRVGSAVYTRSICFVDFYLTALKII